MHPVVNGGDWECIVRDLKTIIVLVLLAFNFIPKVTPMPGDGTTAIKVESSAYPVSLFPRMEKSSEVSRRNNNGPKTALLTQH